MKTLDGFDRQFPTEDSCREYLAALRWPNGVCCPRCGNEKVYKLKQRFRWQCQKCAPKGYRFGPLVGTIFMDTKITLKTWFKVAYMMLQSKKGISALQIHRMMKQSGGSDYRTCWFMCHRLRAAMRNEEWPLGGEVEVDETFIGGKDKNRHWDKKTHIRGGEMSDKTTAIGAIARKGNVVCKIIESTDTPTLDKLVRQTVANRVSLVATDEHSGYRFLKPTLPHEVVTHGKGEYVRGRVHTNNIESFWSLLKRGVIGTYHQVSKDYLPLYLNEFSFRHNFRNADDPLAQLNFIGVSVGARRSLR
jgi:transposase-like protein